MKRIVFVDLDDTLFQTARKNPTAAHIAAVDKTGQPLSFQCGKQIAFLEWLARDAQLVAVTGRSVDAYRRVLLPLGEQAICSFGGVILQPDGSPHPAWHQTMAAAAHDCAPQMVTLEQEIAALCAELEIDARHRIIYDAELPLYLSIKHNQHAVTELAQLAAASRPLLPTNWVLHLNGNNMAVLPPFLDKRRAVAFFLQQLTQDGPVVTIGVGDSLTDLGFMALCDYAIAPNGSQILNQFHPTPARTQEVA